MTSYQKLKAQNEKLKKDLRTLALYPQSFEAQEIIGIIKTTDQIERVAFYGNADMYCKLFSGISTQIQRSNDRGDSNSNGGPIRHAL